ncbi:MAG: metalloregulator ArsR/SmtB family transcription factor [Chloroflexi bacterium]|nr:metalloregulator ArsR/SmtB family transcription factor [Chloroflexota bacterium]
MDKKLLKEINLLHAQICGGLADPKRIAILYALADGAASVNELAEALEMPQATLSRHLKVLRDRGIVVATRQGMNIFYSLADKRILQALDLLRQVLAKDLSKRSALAEALS